MPRQSVHKLLVSVREWEWLSNCATRAAKLASLRKERRVATILSALAFKLEKLGEEVGQDQFVAPLNRVELKELLNRAKQEREVLSSKVLPNHEASRPNHEVYLARTIQYLKFLDDLIAKMEARL